MSEFKGTKGKWVLHNFSPEGHKSVRNKDNTRRICVSRVNNLQESTFDLLLISKAPEMLDTLIQALDWVFQEQGKCNMFYKIQDLIKEATEL